MSTGATVATPAPNIAQKPLLVRRAAVLGAGTMGSRIAAHLANAGIPVLLLDLPPKNQIAVRALEALAKSKPAAFFEPSRAALITPGTFDDDLPKLAAATGSSKQSPKTSRSKPRCSPASFLISLRMRFSPPTPPACPLPTSLPPFPPCEPASSAHTSSIRRATCASLK